MQFPCVFGALSVKGQCQEANVILRGGGDESAAAVISLAHTGKNVKLQTRVGYRADNYGLKTNGASEIPGALIE